VPGTERAPWLKPALQLIAPVQQAVGVHWDPFDGPILPPLIEPPRYPLSCDRERILVYLPFENCTDVARILAQFPGWRFILYAGVEQGRREGNLEIKPFSREGFQLDLAACGGVIANAGFGLCSEAIQAGKKLLVKPLAQQIEQAANARALELLGHARVMQALDTGQIADWLQLENPPAQCWPDTAGALVDWLLAGRQESIDRLACRLWQEMPARAGVAKR